ncbi:MAG TPA: UrcA family protein [Caulobacteraceae bacterium]|jgi:UrcA family protein
MSAKTLLTTAALIASVAFAGTAFAASSDPDAVSVKVAIGDLNLGDATGAATALQRIHNAAGSICGGRPYALDLQRTADYRQCMAATVGQAVASLASPNVTALYNGQRVMVLTASR